MKTITQKYEIVDRAVQSLVERINDIGGNVRVDDGFSMQQEMTMGHEWIVHVIHYDADRFDKVKETTEKWGKILNMEHCVEVLYGRVRGTTEEHLVVVQLDYKRDDRRGYEHG